MKDDHLEDLTAQPWCTALLSDSFVMHLSKRLVPGANSESAYIHTMLLRTLFTDGSIRAYVTLFRPGNEQKRELNAGKMWVKIALAPSETSS